MDPENQVADAAGQIEDNQTTTTEAQAPESSDIRDMIGAELDKIDPEQAQQKPPEPEKEAQPTTATDEPKRDPWKSWKKEAAAELSKLPQNVQDYIVERQEQFHKGLEQYKEAANFAKSIDKSIAPYKDYLNSLNVAPEVAFPNLLKTEHTLRMGSAQEKVEMLRKLAHDYQIDIETLASVPFDPRLHHMQQQLDYTKAQLDASNSFRQSQEDAVIQEHIQDFANGREHFETVRLTMADLLEKGLASDLDDAYAKAIRLDENVFSKLQTQQHLSQQRQELSRADQAAKAAKASAVSVKGSPVGVKTTATPTTTEDAVRMAMRQHGLL